MLRLRQKIVAFKKKQINYLIWSLTPKVKCKTLTVSMVKYSFSQLKIVPIFKISALILSPTKIAHTALIITALISHTFE